MVEREEILEAFSKGLKSFLDRSGISANRLAEFSGCSPSNISKMKKRQGLPSLEVLCSFIEQGMTIEEIFGKERAKILVEQFVKESSENSPIETARQAQGVLKLLLAQVEKLQNGDA